MSDWKKLGANLNKEQRRGCDGTCAKPVQAMAPDRLDSFWYQAMVGKLGDCGTSR